MSTSFLPDTTPAPHADEALRRSGWAVLAPNELGALTGISLDGLQALAPSWNDLPPDEYLKDGGRYRRRRHSCFIAEGDELTAAPHRAHWQPVEYN
ncbi:MAG: 2OG-Fe dioxygenase family protein, partial [Burkholderiales bacterium]